MSKEDIERLMDVCGKNDEGCDSIIFSFPYNTPFPHGPGILREQSSLVSEDLFSLLHQMDRGTQYRQTKTKIREKAIAKTEVRERLIENKKKKKLTNVSLRWVGVSRR